MIYIKTDTNLVQSISIPKYFDPIGDIKLRLTNNLTHQVIEIEPKSTTITEPYFKVDFKLREPIADGEYNYSLVDSRGVMSFGIAVIGNYEREVKSYDKTNKKVQYNR